MSAPPACSHYGILPQRRDLFYGGTWHTPHGGYAATLNPANQDDLGAVAVADSTDVDAAVAAAEQAFVQWRLAKPVERAAAMHALAARVRARSRRIRCL